MDGSKAQIRVRTCHVMSCYVMSAAQVTINGTQDEDKILNSKTFARCLIDCHFRIRGYKIGWRNISFI